MNSAPIRAPPIFESRSRAFPVVTSVVSAATASAGTAVDRCGAAAIAAGDCTGTASACGVGSCATGGGGKRRLPGNRIGVRMNTAPVSSRASTKRLFIAARSVGNRVVPARMERMATHNATCGQPSASPRPVAVHRVDRVVRATGRVSARRRQQRSENDLVSANDEEQRELSGCADHGWMESCGARCRTATSKAPNLAS